VVEVGSARSFAIVACTMQMLGRCELMKLEGRLHRGSGRNAYSEKSYGEKSDGERQVRQISGSNS
jgi:hypothetical protein